MRKDLFSFGRILSVYLSFAFLLTSIMMSNTLNAQYVVDFEAESSGGYASETVTLNGIDWDLTECLIGNLANDFKNGLKSLRLRGYGASAFTMLQDKPNGIGTISFEYSEYGTDTQTSWKVEYSTDGGGSWTQVGADFTATGGNTNPETFNETVNVLGNARIRVVEATGAGTSNRRTNIDDISITDYSTSTPAITATPTTLTGFTQFVGNPSAEQTFEVSGSNLTSDITLNVTAGDYEISETTGAGFGTSITLAQTAGEVAATTIYVRLNGGAAASPSNGTVTLIATDATDVEVLLEGEILEQDPIIFVDPVSLNGFSHFVGTPSAEQTFEVSGEFLDDPIVITAPGEYEISTASGTGFVQSLNLSPVTGTVAATTIYIRLDGAAANYNQNGDVLLQSTGATDKTVTLEGETLDYALYPIGSVTTNDANGVVDSLNVLVELRGVVHCIDFDGDAGYSFTIIDSEGDGINVFNFDDVDGYVVTEGDSIGVKGDINQFNGLTQIFAEEITLFTQGNTTETPLVVTALDESTESQLVTLEGLTLVNGEATWPINGNIDVTDGTNNYTIRVSSASSLAGTATPSGAFDATGLGGQFDTSSPYDAGYQLFPCSITELCNVDVSTTVDELTITAVATGLDYQWVDCNDNFAPIAGETNQVFTASANGSYAVILTDGACIDTSDCVEITTVGLTSNEFVEGINVYPNPVSNEMQVNVSDDVILSIEVFSTSGQSVYSESFNESKITVATSSWEPGVYFVNVTTNNGSTTLKVVK